MLTPNSPIKRLKYVIRQYDGTKNQSILPDVIVISLYAFGRDRDANNLSESGVLPVLDWWHGFEDPMWTLGPEAPPYDHQMQLRYLQEYLDDALPPTHDWDFIVPWVAKELGRLRKAIHRAQQRRERGLPPEAEGVVPGRGLDEYDYANAVSILVSKTPAIAMWALQNRVDLNKTSLAEALEGVKDFEVEAEGTIPQGLVVYEYGDGWTMQRLDSDALETEGELMQHCVGSYCEEVEEDVVAIFSLRDPKGRPYVTIEWRYDWTIMPTSARGLQMRDQLVEEVGLVSEVSDRHVLPHYLPVSSLGTFEQILGKQNEPPVDKYRPYVQTFIKERFNADPTGLLLVWTPEVGIISFEGHHAKELDFDELNEEILERGGAGIAAAARFAGGTFERCSFGYVFEDVGGRWPKASEPVSLSDATLNRCTFNTVRDVDFDGAELEHCAFTDVVERCLFLHARVSKSEFMYGQRECDWRGATVFLTQFSDLTLGCQFDDVTFERVTWTHIDIRSCTFKGARFIQMGAVLGRIQDSDLSRARFDDTSFDAIVHGFHLKTSNVKFPEGPVPGDTAPW